jgi:hypothetical protein
MPADLHHLLNLDASQFRYGGAAVGHTHNQPKMLQLQERLAHGNLADIQLPGKMCLT